MGPSVIDSPKVLLPEGTVSRPKLDLADEGLRTSITYVIHIGRSLDYCYVYAMLTSTGGWRVEFGVETGTFEDDIKGIRNLIELTPTSSLSSPHFPFKLFCRPTYYPLRSSTLAHCLFPQVTLTSASSHSHHPEVRHGQLLVVSRSPPLRLWESPGGLFEFITVCIGCYFNVGCSLWKPSEWIPSITLFSYR